MIDTEKEKLKSFATATKTIQGRPHISTLHRWREHGIQGIQLETVMIGGRRYTSDEALSRFFAAVTAAANGEPPPVRTPGQRKRDIEKAEKELMIPEQKKKRPADTDQSGDGS
jgi:hypothetical protein